jgi:hypothetical protein
MPLEKDWASALMGEFELDRSFAMEPVTRYSRFAFVS